MAYETTLTVENHKLFLSESDCEDIIERVREYGFPDGDITSLYETGKLRCVFQPRGPQDERLTPFKAGFWLAGTLDVLEAHLDWCDVEFSEPEHTRKGL